MASSARNPHLHPFVKWSQETKSYEESFVYDQVTGEKVLGWPIDVRDMLKQKDGRYALTPPAPKEDESVTEAQPSESAAPEAPARRGPGRPRTNPQEN